LGNSRLSFRGMFGPAGAAQVTVNRRNLSPLSIALQLDLVNGTDHITGTVSDGSWTAELAGDRAVFNGKTQIAPQTGSYTFIIPGSDDSASEPQGHSYGTMSVTATGRVRLRGMLADNTKFSQSSAVSKHGQCPLYSSLYGGPGLVLSWLTFSNAPAHDLTGELLWTKPAMANTRFYPAGFNLQKTISGSRYDRPAKGVRVLDFANAELLLRGGNLTESIASRFTLGADNRITDLGTNRLSLSFSLSSGLFKGSVLNPATAKTLKLNGVLVQKRNAGYGCFLGSDQSGSVALREE